MIGRSQAAPREISPEEWKQHQKMFRVSWGELIGRAAAGRDIAVSYRDFKVGCSVLIWDAVKKTYRKDQSGNLKPEENHEERGDRKRCAERNVIRRAVNGSGDLVVGFVVLSSKTVTELGHPERAVLHSCKDCRCLMRELIAEDKLRPESIALFVNDRYLISRGELVTETMTVGQLLEAYLADGDCENGS